MSFALNVMTFGGLWTLAAILFNEVKYRFYNDHYFVFFWHTFTELCYDLLHYSDDF
jgi:hypothetical protein